MKTGIQFWLGCILLLGSWLAQASDDSAFLAAREAYRAGNLAALDHDAARVHSDLLRPYLDYWRINLSLSTATNQDIQSWIAAHDDTPLSAHLQIDWLHELARRNDWQDFLQQYPHVNQPDGDLQCLDWQATLATGGSPPQAAIRFWHSGALVPASCYPVYHQLFASQQLGTQDAWLHARNALAVNSQAAALEAFGWLPDQPFTSRTLESIASNPAGWLAQPHDLQQVAERELTRYAIYRLAWHDAHAAADSWTRLQSGWEEQDRRRIWGEIAIQAARQHLPEARQWFSLTDPKQLGDDGLAWQARAALLAGDWSAVRQAVLAMSDSGRQQPAWQYWLARSQLALGHPRAANLLLLPLSSRNDFYGLLAQDQLGAVASAPTISYTVSGDDVAGVQQLPGIQRALMLYDLDLRLNALREWKWATRQMNDRQLLAAAELARQHRWLDCAINTADRSHDLHNYELSFLAPYRDIANEYAQSYQLDEAWVYGLIRQESRFVSHARSGVGASGLMQVMPKTAQWIARRLGLRHFHTQHLNEPQTSLKFGMYYLKTVLARLDNSSLLATAAYNAGPNRALRWRPASSVEGAIYAETIPFSETRDYVKKVFANTVFYARNFNQPDTSLTSLLGKVTPTASACPGNSSSGGCGNLP